MDFPSRPSARSAREEDPSEARFDVLEPASERNGGPAARAFPRPAAARREGDPAVPERPLGTTPERRARRRRGTRSETFARILWAVPWLVLAITVTVLGGLVFALAMTAIAWAVLVELFRMTQRARPLGGVAFVTVAAMVLAAPFGQPFHILLALASSFPLLLGFALLRGSLRNITWSLAVTVFAIVWIGLPFAHAVLLRDLPLHGAALLVDVLVATFFTDTFAYFGGRMFGQRPLAPLVSPNKTVEGLGIGILGGVLGFWLAGLYQDWLSGPEALLLGFCIAILAPLGDLFESMIKRDLDVKDTGRMLGPHGGLLDRLDAVLFTVVGGYYLALAIAI